MRDEGRDVLDSLNTQEWAAPIEHAGNNSEVYSHLSTRFKHFLHIGWMFTRYGKDHFIYFVILQDLFEIIEGAVPVSSTSRSLRGMPARALAMALRMVTTHCSAWV